MASEAAPTGHCIPAALQVAVVQQRMRQSSPPGSFGVDLREGYRAWPRRLKGPQLRFSSASSTRSYSPLLAA
eukprot:4841578-Pyramimonas_sp.AAC.1